MYKIYHNPRCSKSRAAVSLLEEKNIQFSIIEYLKNPPSPSELKSILEKLKISARDLLRTNEIEYKENNLSDPDLSNEQIIDIISKFPKLIQRPIIITDNNGVIARPIDNLISLIEND